LTIDVILNQGSGTLDKLALAETITKRLDELGAEARVRIIHSGRELLDARKRAISSDAPVVVAGGGDGTVATIAEGLVGSGKSLGVIPLGTFNYFAKTLGIPAELEEALAVIAGGRVTSADVGDVNGNIFLNNSSIGLYPAVLQQRELTYRRFGRSQFLAYLSVPLTLVQPARLVNLTITADGRPLSRRTPLLFIGANALQMESLGIVGGSCIADHRFALYVARPMGAMKMAALGVRLLLKRLRRSEDFEVICAGEVLIGLRRRRVHVALDGEVRVLETPLRYKLRREALRVIVPAEDAACTRLVE